MKTKEFDYNLMCLKFEVKKLESMLDIIKSNKKVSLFHAQKSLYVELPSNKVTQYIINPILIKILSIQLKKAQSKLDKYIISKL